MASIPSPRNRKNSTITVRQRIQFSDALQKWKARGAGVVQREAAGAEGFAPPVLHTNAEKAVDRMIAEV